MKNKKFNLQLFAMKNKDLAAEQKAAIMVKLNEAMKEGNDEAFQAAFTEFTDMLQESVLAEAKGIVEAADNNILMGRGARPLTSSERKYYESLIDAMNSKNPQQALTMIDEAMPKTVIDAVFEDIIESHPLLDAINFQNTGALTEILVSTLDGRFMATWGKLCDEITKELASGFQVIDLEQKKLSAFIPVCKAMLEVGPEWLDRYVRAILAEGLANGLEDGIVNGDGLDAPIGMRRNPAGAMDPVTGYPLLALEVLNELTPSTYGNLIAGLATGPNGLSRVINEVLLIVNPIDYFSKLMGSTTHLVNGVWVNDRFPFPTRVIQSVHVPQNEAVIGIGRRYFFGLGTSKGGKLEFSDHYRFLEDERVYLTKLYGDGKPLDNVSFKRLNITNLIATPFKVYVANTDLDVDVVNSEGDPLFIAGVDDARLASLSIGALTLSPAFNKSIFYYTASTTNATNTITAAPLDGEATIVIDVDETPVVNGTAATWAEGANEVTIEVTSGTATETYTVIVTKS